MKRIQFLAIRAFLKPFAVVLPVLLFIFLTQHMLKYADYIAGRGVGLGTIGELMFYFAFFLLPKVMPLAILLSALMAFGTLGQHNELTAIKSAGISLARLIMPVFAVVLIIAGLLYMYNDHILPKMNIKAWSLMYDIKVKKPALNLKEGAFYNEIKGFSIKIDKKEEDEKTIRGVLIYDHRDGGMRNNHVITADSGQMYTIMNDRYLVMELHHGNEYHEDMGKERSNHPKLLYGTLYSSSFKYTKLVFDLSGFDFKRTPEEKFLGNKETKNFEALWEMVDSNNRWVVDIRNSIPQSYSNAPYFHFHYKPHNADLDISSLIPDRFKKDTSTIGAANVHFNSDTVNFDKLRRVSIYNGALNQARSMAAMQPSFKERIWVRDRDGARFAVEAFYRYNTSIGCLILFIIGASIGAIVKKGGLGIPSLISVAMFVFYYTVSMQGEKMAKEVEIDVFTGMMACNAILLPAAIFFFIKAKNDASISLPKWFKHIMPFKIRLAERSIPEYNQEARMDFDHLNDMHSENIVMIQKARKAKARRSVIPHINEQIDYIAQRTDDENIRSRLQSIRFTSVGLNPYGIILLAAMFFVIMGWMGPPMLAPALLLYLFLKRRSTIRGDINRAISSLGSIETLLKASYSRKQ